MLLRALSSRPSPPDGACRCANSGASTMSFTICATTLDSRSHLRRSHRVVSRTRRWPGSLRGRARSRARPLRAPAAGPTARRPRRSRPPRPLPRANRRIRVRAKRRREKDHQVQVASLIRFGRVVPRHCARASPQMPSFRPILLRRRRHRSSRRVALCITAAASKHHDIAHYDDVRLVQAFSFLIFCMTVRRVIRLARRRCA